MHDRLRSQPDATPRGVRTFCLLGTGRRALSWQVTATLLLAYLGLALLVEWPPVPMSLAGVCIALAAQWAVLRLAFPAVLDRRGMRRRPVLRAALVIVVVCGVGLATLVLLGGLVGRSAVIAETPAMWLARAGLLLLATATWAVVEDYRRGLADARVLQATLAQTRADGIAMVRAQRADVVERLTEMLETGLVPAFDSMPADSLRRLAREQIRPLSHDLASALPAFEPRRPVPPPPASWRVVLGAALDRPIVRPGLLALLITVLFFTQTGAQTSNDGAGPPTPVPTDATGVGVAVDLTSLLWSVGYLAVVFVAAWLAGVIAVRALTPRLAMAPTEVRVAWVLLIPLVLSVAIQIATQFLHALGEDGDPAPGFLTRVLTTWPIVALAFFLLLILRSVNALLSATRRRLSRLTDDVAWESARARETLIQERRYFATAVHGPLQSAVAAAALAIEDGLRQGVDVEAAWGAARHGLLAAVRALESGPPQHRDLVAESQALIGTWTGLCEVTVDVGSDAAAVLAADWVTAGTVADLLTEAVTNAVVHGRATHVRIEIAQEEPTTVRVVVEDDGVGTESPGAPGLGSQQLDEVATRWAREFADGATRLEVFLPADSSEPSRSGA